MDKGIWREPHKCKALDESQSPLWFWNDRLENEELKRQLEMMSEVGVKCANPHARTNGGEGFIGGYLDDEWFDHIKTVLDYKKEHDEPMWLYDEIDWPAGTCNQTITLDERNREQYLVIERVEIPAGEKFRAQLKEFSGKGTFAIGPDTDLSGCSFNVTIVDKETGDPYDIKDYFTYLMFGPELEFVSDRDAVAFVVDIRVDAYEYGGNEAVNYLDSRATKAFIKSTYDPYYEHFGEDFGRTIKAVFNDETRMCHAFAWSRDFAGEFIKRKGYDILPNLYKLIIPGIEAGRYRYDYFDVLASLYQENYFGVLHNWCKDHNIKLFAHLLGEETVFGHARYSGDYLRQNRYLDIPGADHLGKGIGSLNIKYTACGAHSYGKEMTAVEVFAGCGWDMTADEYLRMVTWMFQQGMQIIINHGFFYSDRGNRKNDWPPSQFFQWQGWDRMKEANAMTRRLHYALTGGVSEADILIYQPTESFWLHYIPDQRYTHGFFKGAFVKDEEAAKIDKNMQLLLNGLMSENLDFDLIHKDAVDNFKSENDKIVNILNGQSFKALILPMCETVPLKFAKMCLDFAKAGGRIFALDTVPYMAEKNTDDEKVKEIFDNIQALGALKVLSMDEPGTIYESLRDTISLPVRITAGVCGTKNNHVTYPDYLIDPYIHTGEDIEGVMFTRYIKDGKRNTLFVNYGKTGENILVFVKSGDDSFEMWDTLSGEISKVEAVCEKDGEYTLNLCLPAGHGVILVSDL
ncbi:MAG: hypothetical protein J6033_06025 [Lachnospiraceae bacterium]|nr:hypothetical protein [Lachnospiraceae bacterium]